MIKRCFVLFSLAFVCFAAHAAENYEARFNELFRQGKLDEIEKLLPAWEKQEPGNIEMLIAYFNYYAARATVSQAAMGQMPDGRYGLYDDVSYRAAESDSAISYLDKALASAPDRLDVYFGKCTFLLRVKRFGEARDAILAVLRRSGENGGSWLWKHNESLSALTDKSAESVLVLSINDYIEALFYQYEETGPMILEILELENSYFPRNAVCLNQLARYYIYEDDIPRAVELLKGALEFNPEDSVVMGNLAYCYERQGDAENARFYYKKLLDSDDLYERNFAGEALERLDGSGI